MLRGPGLAWIWLACVTAVLSPFASKVEGQDGHWDLAVEATGVRVIGSTRSETFTCTFDNSLGSELRILTIGLSLTLGDPSVAQIVIPDAFLAAGVAIPEGISVRPCFTVELHDPLRAAVGQAEITIIVEPPPLQAPEIQRQVDVWIPATGSDFLDDGYTDLADLGLFVSWLTGPLVHIDPGSFRFGDIDGDGDVDMKDASVLFQSFTPAPDCNHNGIPDKDEIARAPSVDCDANGIIDECEIAQNGSLDRNGNGVIDLCEILRGDVHDCNENFIPDEWEILSGLSTDCDGDGVLDTCQLAWGFANDCDGDGILDACEADCQPNGIPDKCEIAAQHDLDKNHDGVPDVCQDCNGDGIVDSEDPASLDLNGDGIPDTCPILSVDSPTCAQDFGISMCSTRAFVVIGAPSQVCDDGLYCGAVAVYRRAQNGSLLSAELLRAPGGTALARFGGTITCDGKWLAVGAPGDGCLDVGKAKVYVYEVSSIGSDLVQVLQSPSNVICDGFANALSVKDDWLVVGAPASGVRDYSVHAQGFAYVYHYEGSNWVPYQALNNPPPSSPGLSDGLGWTLAMDAGTLMVGVGSERQPFLVQTYQLEDVGGWTASQRLHAYGILECDEGICVACNVGVQVFRRDGRNWGDESGLLSLDYGAFAIPNGDTRIDGLTCAISQGAIVVAADGFNVRKTVLSYIFDGQAWVLDRPLDFGRGQIESSLRFAVGALANTAIVGVPAIRPQNCDGYLSGRGEVFFVKSSLYRRMSRETLSSGGFEATGTDARGGFFQVGEPSMTSDGRYVAFPTSASNLQAGHTNTAWGVFVHDRLTGQATRIDLRSDGSEPVAGLVGEAMLAGDGRFIVFDSPAPDLTDDDGNGNVSDVFLHDMQTKETVRVSSTNQGRAQGNNGSYVGGISDDGRFVAFTSYASDLVPNDTNHSLDAFMLDRQVGNIVRVSPDAVEPNNATDSVQVSGDGRFVIFASLASNLIADDNNAVKDVFIFDVSTHAIKRVSVPDSGGEANAESLIYKHSISADGRFVAFLSNATNLVEGDTNGVRDAFVRDRSLGRTFVVSVNSAGVQVNNRVGSLTISGSGNRIAFRSGATNLDTRALSGVDQIYVRDLATGVTVLASDNNAGEIGNGTSQLSWLSGDGSFVAFWSMATNFVDHDTNGNGDVFVRWIPLLPENAIGPIRSPQD